MLILKIQFLSAHAKLQIVQKRRCTRGVLKSDVSYLFGNSDLEDFDDSRDSDYVPASVSSEEAEENYCEGEELEILDDSICSQIKCRYTVNETQTKKSTGYKDMQSRSTPHDMQVQTCPSISTKTLTVLDHESGEMISMSDAVKRGLESDLEMYYDYGKTA